MRVTHDLAVMLLLATGMLTAGCANTDALRWEREHRHWKAQFAAWESDAIPLEERVVNEYLAGSDDERDLIMWATLSSEPPERALRLWSRLLEVQTLPTDPYFASEVRASTLQSRLSDDAIREFVLEEPNSRATEYMIGSLWPERLQLVRTLMSVDTLPDRLRNRLAWSFAAFGVSPDEVRTAIRAILRTTDPKRDVSFVSALSQFLRARPEASVPEEFREELARIGNERTAQCARELLESIGGRTHGRSVVGALVEPKPEP